MKQKETGNIEHECKLGTGIKKSKLLTVRQRDNASGLKAETGMCKGIESVWECAKVLGPSVSYPWA